MSKQIKITVQQGDDGAKGVVEYDAFVLVGWDMSEDGGSQVFTQTSAPPGHDAEHLLVAARAIARAMKTHENPLAKALGTVMHNTIQQGVDHLENAMKAQELQKKELPEG